MTAKFISVAETAQTLGVSSRLVYDLIDRGDLPAVDLGTRKMVPREAIDLVVAKAMEGFDPTRIVSRLAGAGGASSDGPDASASTEDVLPGPARLHAVAT